LCMGTVAWRIVAEWHVVLVIDLTYVATPFAAWLIAGGLKFVINSIRARRLAFGLIGYGGLPSNHTAIVTSVVALLAVRVGIDSPLMAIAIALAFVVILDARSLRGQVGKHAVALNKLSAQSERPLRERIGHTPAEILAGAVVGAGVGIAMGWIFG